MAKKVGKTIDDFRAYLAEFKRMAKGLSPDQTAQLNQILISLMVLLVSLRQASHLGEATIDLDKF